MPIVDGSMCDLNFTVNLLRFIQLFCNFDVLNKIASGSPSQFIHHLFTIAWLSIAKTFKVIGYHSSFLGLWKRYHISWPQQKEASIVDSLGDRSQQLADNFMWCAHIDFIFVKEDDRIVYVLFHLWVLAVIALLWIEMGVLWSSSRRIYRCRLDYCTKGGILNWCRIWWHDL